MAFPPVAGGSANTLSHRRLGHRAAAGDDDSVHKSRGQRYEFVPFKINLWKPDRVASFGILQSLVAPWSQPVAKGPDVMTLGALCPQVAALHCR